MEEWKEDRREEKGGRLGIGGERGLGMGGGAVGGRGGGMEGGNPPPLSSPLPPHPPLPLCPLPLPLPTATPDIACPVVGWPSFLGGAHGARPIPPDRRYD